MKCPEKPNQECFLSVGYVEGRGYNGVGAKTTIDLEENRKKILALAR